jgi:hypothetical protein
MITLRQLERFFDQQQFRRLYQELIAGRPEASAGFDVVLSRVMPIAALGMIRLDELTQSHTPLYRRLLNVVLTSQQKDGGWGDPVVSALCIRALLLGNGHGAATACGFAYLAALQKDEGTWPREPLRRMPADAQTTAFILLQLGEHDLFRRVVRFDDAVDWFTVHNRELDATTRQLWSHAQARCRLTLTGSGRIATLWCPSTRSAAA